MASLNYSKLYKINMTGDDLVQSLSPGISDHNMPLFRSYSGNIEKFRSNVKSRNIEIIGDSYPELDDRIQSARQEIENIIKNADITKKPRYDLDFAMVIHKHINIPLRALPEYDFWRCLNLFFFIDLTKWRWENDPNNPSKWYSNATAIFRRSTGYSLNESRWKKEGALVYDTRNRRIDVLRYWFIGNKLFDPSKGYYYLEKISEKYKNQEGPLQDFLNQLEGNSLLSEGDRIAKIMADTILLGPMEFSETDMRKSFNRYNAFTKRLLMIADKDIIQKEICLLK